MIALTYKNNVMNHIKKNDIGLVLPILILLFVLPTAPIVSVEANFIYNGCRDIWLVWPMQHEGNPPPLDDGWTLLTCIGRTGNQGPHS